MGAVIISILIFSSSLAFYIHTISSSKAFWYKFDLLAYYNAGANVIHGKNIYLAGRTYFDFVYPPFSAILFSYMTHIPFQAAKILMPCASIVALFATIWLSWGLLKYQATHTRLALTFVTTAAALWAEPVQETLYHGQINLLLLLLIVGGFALRDKPFWHGFLVGIAAGIKLTPLIFIVYLLALRRFKTAGFATATFLATIGWGFLFLKPDSILYWSGTFANTSRIGSLTLSGSQSLHATFLRLFGTGKLVNIFWYGTDMIVACIGIGLAVYAYKKKQELLGLILCGITGLLISPFSWTHHWVWLPMLLPLFVHYAYTKRTLGGLIGILLCCIFLWNGRELFFSGFPQIQENAYVVLGLLILVAAAVILKITPFPRRILHARGSK